MLASLYRNRVLKIYLLKILTDCFFNGDIVINSKIDVCL